MKARSFHRLRMPLRITTCVALAVLSACTSPPVHFHTLAMTDSAGSDAVASPPAWLIDIQAVHVTAPADGNRFVVQSGRGRVDILEQERWAAPLGDELRDGLSTRVASRLGTIDIHHVAHAADAPVYRVTVNIQRIESWPASHVLLDATWSVSSGRAAGADLPQRHSGRRIGGLRRARRCASPCARYARARHRRGHSCGSDTRGAARRMPHGNTRQQPRMKPTRLTREQRRLDTRERLIATARALFIAKGFADTSVEHIAECAGYTRGAFYAHFEHKREPLIEILRRDQDRMIGKLRLATPEGGGDCTAAGSTNIAAGWECFPLWVEVHLYALRDAGFRQIIDHMHAELSALPDAAGTSDRMAEWAAVLGVALLRGGARCPRRNEPT